MLYFLPSLFSYTVLFFFYFQSERKAFFACYAGGFPDLGLCNVVSVDTYSGRLAAVYLQHQRFGFGLGLVKNYSEYFYHKVHGGEVVVVDNDPEAARFAQPGVLFFEER